MQTDVDTSIAENKAFIQSYFILYMQQRQAESQPLEAPKPQPEQPHAQNKQGGQYNLAKSYMSGAYKKLSTLGGSGIAMPALPKLSWYQKKKPQEAEETKETQSLVTTESEANEETKVSSDQAIEEDVPNLTAQDDDDETEAGAKDHPAT